VEQTLIFHSDLFHEVSLDYHTTIISQQGIKLFVKKMTKNQESFTSQRCNKIHLFDKNPVFLYMLWGQHANKFDELFNPSG